MELSTTLDYEIKRIRGTSSFQYLPSLLLPNFPLRKELGEFIHFKCVLFCVSLEVPGIRR